ncbi:MAG: hypothetical protein LBT37_03705 [Lactobacillaceae bacterium]|jgi:predicted MFS family arabinose efflux permease|nr:hypothetical protein [Lactobacillaceae bacterium]
MTKNKSFYLFFFLLYLFMTIGSFVQVLYFQETGHLGNFGISYGAMAISGAVMQLSFRWISALKTKLLLNIALILYGMSMTLRLLSYSVSASILSGVIGGLSATTILIIVRLQLMDFASNHENSNKIISSRFIVVQLAEVLGTILGGVMIGRTTNNVNNIQIAIIVVAALVILLILFPKKITVKVHSERKLKIFTGNKHLIKIVLSSLMFGLLVSLVAPLIPAIFNGMLHKIDLVTALTTASTVLALIGSIVIGRTNIANKAYRFLVITMLAMGVLFIVGSHFAALMILIILLYSFANPVYFQLKEVFEYNVIQKYNIDKIEMIAVSQTAFLIGDSIGTPIAGWFMSAWPLSNAMLAYGAINFVFMIIFMTLWQKNKIL